MTDVREQLAQAETFLSDLNDNISLEVLPPDRWGTSFFRRGEASLTLDIEETRRYHEVVASLHGVMELPKQVSRKSVAAWLQQAIFASLDLDEKRRTDPVTGHTVSFGERLSKALDVLKSELTSPPREWQVWHPIEGLSPSELPLEFGPAKFEHLDDGRWRELLCVIADHVDANAVHTDAEKTLIKERYETMWLADLEGAVVATGSVYAHDPTAALDTFRSLLRVTLDAINFVAGADRFNRNLRCRVSLPEDSQRHVTTGIALQTGSMLTTPRTVRGPCEMYS